MDCAVNLNYSFVVRKILRVAGSNFPFLEDRNFVLYLNGNVGFGLREENLKHDLIFSKYIKGPVDSSKIMLEITKGGVNELTSIGYNVFHLAIMFNVKFAEELVKDGVDCEVQTAYGDYPIHLACENMYLPLFNYFKNVNVRNRDGITPLCKLIDKAMSANTPEKFKYLVGFILLLLEKGADPNMPDPNGRKLIDIAFRARNHALVNILIKAGATMTPEQLRFLESFDYQISVNDPPGMEKYLTSHPSITTEEHAKLVWWVIDHSHTNNPIIAGRAFIKGVNYGLMRKNGNSPFLRALEKSDLRAAEMIRVRSTSYVIEEDYPLILQMILDCGTHLWSEMRHILDYLYNSGFKLRDRDFLFEVTKSKYNPSLLFFLFQKEKISNEFKSQTGETFLEAAVEGNTEVLAFLINSGFVLGRKEAYEKAMTLKKLEHARMLQISSERKIPFAPDGPARITPSETNERFVDPDTLVENVVDRQDIELLKVLLKAGGNPDGSEPGIETPLAIAARLGNMKMIDLLLEAGANPRLKYSGRPPSKIAEFYGFYDIAKKLREHFR